MWHEGGVGLEEEENLPESVHLAFQRLYLDFHQGGHRSQVPARRFGERNL